MVKAGVIMITIGLLLCAVAVCLFVYCASLKDDGESVFDTEQEEVKKEVLEMMKELGGDEDE